MNVCSHVWMGCACGTSGDNLWCRSSLSACLTCDSIAIGHARLAGPCLWFTSLLRITGVADACYPAWRFIWVLNSGPRLHGKHFTCWTFPRSLCVLPSLLSSYIISLMENFRSLWLVLSHMLSYFFVFLSRKFYPRKHFDVYFIFKNRYIHIIYTDIKYLYLSLCLDSNWVYSSNIYVFIF